MAGSINWGYKPLSKGRVTDLDQLHTDSRVRSIHEKCPELNTCIACGLCSSTCTAGSFTDYNIRKMHTMIRRGEWSSAATEAQKCMLCGKCTMVCPRGINLRKVVLQIRQLI